MNPVAKLVAKLRGLEAQGLLRHREVEDPLQSRDEPLLIDVCSNDYLGYGRTIVSRETVERSGAGASRLINGTCAAHRALEREIADWLGTADSLLFSSGYAANCGLLAALAGPDDVIISDQLNHASIVDGCRLSRARVIIVPHRDPAAVEAALASVETDAVCWVVTESYFSMDGDTPDLPRLRRACDARDAALYVDEAHALGVFGPEGSGLCRASGVRPDILVGTLGKALGVQGAFVAASDGILDYFWNRARSFVFSTATSPVLAELGLDSVRKARRDDASRERLRVLCNRLRELLGPALPRDCAGPIFPIVLGTPESARRAVEVLRVHGFHGVAIRPPTVPAGACRLRVSLNATLSDDDLLRLGAAIQQCLASL